MLYLIMLYKFIVSHDSLELEYFVFCYGISVEIQLLQKMTTNGLWVDLTLNDRL